MKTEDLLLLEQISVEKNQQTLLPIFRRLVFQFNHVKLIIFYRKDFICRRKPAY